MTGPGIVVRRVGREGEPVAVIDNFTADPEIARAAAAKANFVPSKDYYPGSKAPVPNAYLASQSAILATVFREVFGVSGAVAVLELSFAIVSASVDELALPQRIPHTDGLEPGRLALVHYLVPGGCDGTAFFRHRSTGFETIDRPRSTDYFAALDADLREHGAPSPAYPDGDTPLFERTAHFDGVYNRALIYRGRMLHSGAITPGREHAADAATGRLTITGFFAAD